MTNPCFAPPWSLGLRGTGSGCSGRATVERWCRALFRGQGGCSFRAGFSRMEFRILGPLEVVSGGRVIPLDARKPRALLAILLLRANEPVSRDHLIDELWAGRPPSSAPKVLQTYVSQLRRVLGRDVIRTAPSAYELRADAGSFDLVRFEELVANARTASPATANGMLREALSLWRGPPLAEFAYEPWAQPEIDRLEELRLEVLQGRIESDLALGASAELVAELELLVGQYPHREGLRAQLMLALYRSGQAGGRAGGISRCEAVARRDAGDRADARAAAARTVDPRPGSDAGPRHRRASGRRHSAGGARARRVARRRSWDERASCGRSARCWVARRFGS